MKEEFKTTNLNPQPQPPTTHKQGTTEKKKGELVDQELDEVNGGLPPPPPATSVRY